MDYIENGWFKERCDLWPGQATTLEVKEVLHFEKSKFQEILVVQTTHHGKALILDHIIQLTDFDQHSYHEMLGMLPTQAHENPQSVLVIGGGDCKIIAQLIKHPLITKIDQIEIDERVIEISREHFPSEYFPPMKVGNDYPPGTITRKNSPPISYHLCIGDGFKFLREHPRSYDVIITDSSDPVGPNVSLFGKEYYKLLADSLRGTNGICCLQSGTTWYDLDVIKEKCQELRKHFGCVKFATTSVPTYPTGQIGFLIACLNEGLDPSKPVQSHSADDEQSKQFEYYSSAVHQAAFVLPAAVQRALYQQQE